MRQWDVWWSLQRVFGYFEAQGTVFTTYAQIVGMYLCQAPPGETRRIHMNSASFLGNPAEFTWFVRGEPFKTGVQLKQCDTSSHINL